MRKGILIIGFSLLFNLNFGQANTVLDGLYTKEHNDITPIKRFTVDSSRNNLSIISFKEINFSNVYTKYKSISDGLIVKTMDSVIKLDSNLLYYISTSDTSFNAIKINESFNFTQNYEIISFFYEENLIFKVTFHVFQSSKVLMGIENNFAKASFKLLNQYRAVEGKTFIFSE